MRRVFLALTASLLLCAVVVAQDADSHRFFLLAATRTSTMQKELSDMAQKGYRVVAASPASDSEMVLFLERTAKAAEPYTYRLLATDRTSTMEKELNDAGKEGFRLMPLTAIAKKASGLSLGGEEIVVVMEKAPGPIKRYQYKLLATNRTSTLQKEVDDATAAGFDLVGMLSRKEHMAVVEKQTP